MHLAEGLARSMRKSLARSMRKPGERAGQRPVIGQLRRETYTNICSSILLMSRDLSDETVVARIIGAAARHARRCALSETGHLAAVTEIAGLAGGRADLLAQGAGIAAGFHCGRADEAR